MSIKGLKSGDELINCVNLGTGLSVEFKNWKMVSFLLAIPVPLVVELLPLVVDELEAEFKRGQEKGLPASFCLPALTVPLFEVEEQSSTWLLTAATDNSSSKPCFNNIMLRKDEKSIKKEKVKGRFLLRQGYRKTNSCGGV